MWRYNAFTKAEYLPGAWDGQSPCEGECGVGFSGAGREKIVFFPSNNFGVHLVYNPSI